MTPISLAKFQRLIGLPGPGREYLGEVVIESS